MNQPLKAVKSLIDNGSLDQQYKGTLKKWPLLHFTHQAEAIIREGFRFGESDPDKLDFTHELNGDAKQHKGPGYNFAFNAIHWDDENDMHEFVVATPESGRNLSIQGSSAILFLGDGLHTRHYDEFHQVITWGQDVSLDKALHLKQIGEQIQDGEVVCDGTGNPIDCWTILNAEGKPLIGPEEYLTLLDCVITALHRYHCEGALSAKASKALQEVYEPELDELELKVIPAKKRVVAEAGMGLD